MFSLAIWMGGLLLATAVAVYGVTGERTPMVMIPAAVGVALFVVTAIGRYLPQVRTPAMDVGLGIALVSAAGALMYAVDVVRVAAGTAERPAVAVTSAITFALLSVYIIANLHSTDDSTPEA